MMRIACLLDSGFEDSEFQKPYDAFRDNGHTVTVIGLEDKTLSGLKGTVQTKPDTTIERAQSREYDALFLPGGYSPDHLRADARMVQFVREMAKEEKPILALCHGPQLLITADAIAGRTLTAWRTIQDDLRRMDQNVVDQEVVVDGTLVTSRQPSDIPSFIRESLTLLAKVPAGSR